jgi:hypothetical protein
MRVAGLRGRSARRFAQALLGWTFAMMLVLAAVLGPPLTGQTIPTMVELRHDVLMIDREFERWTIPTNRSGEQEHRLTEASRDG